MLEMNSVLRDRGALSAGIVCHGTANVRRACHNFKFSHVLALKQDALSQALLISDASLTVALLAWTVLPADPN